jgi:hypothetical protein
MQTESTDLVNKGLDNILGSRYLVYMRNAAQVLCMRQIAKEFLEQYRRSKKAGDRTLNRLQLAILVR